MPTIAEEIKTLQGQIMEKSQAFQNLLNEGDLDDAKMSALEGMKTELETLNTDLQAKRNNAGREVALRRTADEYKALMETPANLLPFPGQAAGVPKEAGTYGNGVSVLGLAYDGDVHIESGKSGIDMNYVSNKAYKENAFKACQTKEYACAYRDLLAKGWHNLSNEQQKVLQEGLDIEGGYLSPGEMLNQIIARKPTPTRVQNFVTRITIAGDKVTLPKVNYSTDDIYTTGMRVTWTGEIPASATTHRVTDPVFGQLTIPVYTAMMSIPVSNDLLEDAMIDLESWLSGKFGETIELLRDNMILSGSGINQPMGILANPGGANQPGTVVTGDAANLTMDGLIDLTESLPEQYDDNARLVFNKTNAGKAIRKLKDGDGRPLVTYGAGDFGYAGGRYTEVNGYPFSWSGFMPNVAANAYPIIFGDLTGYYFVDRIGLSITPLRELYAETNQVLLLGRVRMGGMTAEEWRLKIQKVST